MGVINRRETQALDQRPRCGLRAPLLAMMLLILLTVPFAARAQNLVKNGDFEGGTNSDGEPKNWHTRLTSLTPIPEYRDPEHKQGRTGVVHFKCGCGYDWGTVRPWAMLVCPKCHHTVTGLEDAADWYNKNHESVSLVDGATGKALGMKLSEEVGNNQGVRALSDLIKADHNAGYQVMVDGITRGATERIWVEGFALDEDDKVAKEWLKTLPPECNPQHTKGRLKRVFRQQIHVNSPHQWTSFHEEFASEGSYAFDYMFVSLYAYLPGEAGYDNVVIRRLTPDEMVKYHQENEPPPQAGQLR